MKKILYILLVTSFIINLTSAFAVPVRNLPVMRIQPNGDTLRCYVSGDEYYHRLHDAAGYTIMQDARTGWYVYADREWDGSHRDWQLVATSYIAGSVNPATLSISPNLIASPATIEALHRQWEVPNSLQAGGAKAVTNVNRGTINNLVIFIRFADDDEITTPFSTIESMFNDSTAEAVSMHNYFWRASYGQLRIPTYFYPSPNGNTIVSYQDTYTRDYYIPYNSTTNPNGYQNDNQRANREFSLLERAVNYVNQLGVVPTDINFDMDNDGNIDNICFIVKGTYTDWNDLLWPHKWSLYDRHVYINGKRVYTFNLQLEGSGSHYFSTSTFCHEMFHTLGAPDLYHYYNYTGVASVGAWDIMCNNTNPPQHMGMYMKMRYGKWIDTIPEITEAGTYTLNSVGDSVHTLNQCYRIKAADPSQWYLLEYRDNRELFETALGGRGLLIYRIDSRWGGCAYFDASTVFDEVYIFRPGGSNDTTGGTLSQAFFSSQSGRSSFSATTDPHPWLTHNVIDTTIEISNIGFADNTISFTYTPHRPQVPDCGDSSCTITVDMTDRMGDTWNGAYLSFENLDGKTLATATMGDGRTSERQTIRVCRQPIVAKWNEGAAPNECGYSIILGDSSVWKNIITASNTTNLGVILDPCQRTVPRQYTITVQSSDTINYAGGGGTYEEGTFIYILAQEENHYNFKGWHDGPYDGDAYNAVIHSTDRRRHITVTGDSLFTAIFTPEMFTVQVITARGHETYGTVTGNDTVPYGTPISISATPAPGYEFDYWRKNYDTRFYYENPLNDIVTGNVTYRAFFKSTTEGITLPDNIRIYTAGNNLVVRGAEGHQLEVVNTLGQSITSGIVKIQNPEFVIALPSRGIYLVRIDQRNTTKVLAR